MLTISHRQPREKRKIIILKTIAEVPKINVKIYPSEN